MEHLAMWSDLDAEMLLSSSSVVGGGVGGAVNTSGSSALEIDSLSPTLLMSAAPHLSTDFLLDDLSLDGAPLVCGISGDPLGHQQQQQQHQQQQQVVVAQQTQHQQLLLLQQQPSPLQPPQQHSHDGRHLCEYSASACPLNPYGGDPIFSQPLLTATPDTVAALRGAVTRPPPSSPPPPPPPAQPATSVANSRLPPPPYPGQRHRVMHQQQQQQSSVQQQHGAKQSPVRAPPRLKVARRLNNNTGHHQTGGGGGASLHSAHHRSLTPLAARQMALSELQLSASPPLTPQSPAAAAVAAAGGGGGVVVVAGGGRGHSTSLAVAACKHTKPNLSYVNLITLALLNSPAGSLRCNEIYEFLQRAFPYFREVNSKTWKNDTRHALSSNQSSSNFCKAPETKTASNGGNRGALWMAKPEKMEFLHEHLAKTYHKFADNIREAMGSPELYDELAVVVQQGASCVGQFVILDVASPCAQSPTVGSTTDSPDGLLV